MTKTVKVYQMMEQIRAMPVDDITRIFTVADVFTSSDVINEIDFNYSGWEITVNPGHTADVGFFIDVWTHYKSTTEYQLKRIYDSLHLYYDPITNYELWEESADGRKLSKETDTTTPTGGVQSTSYRYGIDTPADGAPSDRMHSVPDTGAKTETTREYQNNQTLIFDEITHAGYHDANEHFLKRRGNIGVQTPADMLLREKDVRKINLLKTWIHEFFSTYGFCIGGV